MTDLATCLRRVAAIIIMGVLCSLLQVATAALPAPLARELEALGLPESAISLYIHPIGKAEPRLSHRADQPRNPASAMKLVTTAAALDLLGPTHHWQTNSYLLGSLHGGQLKGDLLLQGGGDPQLVIEDFWRLVLKMRRRGLRHIAGDLVLDSSLFDRASINARPLDRQLYRAYNAPPDALLVNFRATRIEIIPHGQTIHAAADPPATTLTLDNRVNPLQGRCKGRRGGVTLTVQRTAKGTLARLGGHYPPACGPYSFTRTLLMQDAYVYGVFRHLWQSAGGTISGGWRRGVAPSQTSAFTTHPSRSLANVVRDINKFSNNVMARNLLLALATDQAPATPVAGRAAVHAWLDTVGLRMPHLKIDNGAGLSRTARVSASGLGRMLLYAWHGPWQPEFVASLPLAGLDGSLRKRFGGLAPPGRVRLKSGRLNGVRAMAGYAVLAGHRPHVVIILLNQPKLSNRVGDAVPAAVLRWLFEAG